VDGSRKVGGKQVRSGIPMSGRKMESIPGLLCLGIIVGITTGLVTGIIWYVGSIYWIGHTPTALILFCLFILLAVRKARSGVTGVESGPYESVAGNVALAWGISMWGILGGVVGFVCYLALMEILVMFGRRVKKKGAPLAALVSLLRSELPTVVGALLSSAISIFVLNRLFPSSLNVVEDPSLANYLVLCIVCFGATNLLAFTVEAMQSR
jgi:hypothetical protein